MPYSQQIIQSVWEKGRVIAGQDPAEWRQDACGAWMRRAQYGHESLEYGWKIENVLPGGAAEPENLRPFHTKNSYDVSAGRAHCRVTADQKHVDPHERLASAPRNQPAGAARD